MESIRKWKEERELQCSWSGSCRVRGHVKASRGVECDGVLKFLCVEVAGNSTGGCAAVQAPVCGSVEAIAQEAAQAPAQSAVEVGRRS